VADHQLTLEMAMWFECMTEYGFTKHGDFMTVVKNVYREDATYKRRFARFTL